MDPFEEAEAKVSCYIYGQVISLFTNYDNCSLLLLRSKLQRLVMRGSQERPLNSRQDTPQYSIKRLSPCYACLYSMQEAEERRVYRQGVGKYIPKAPTTGLKRSTTESSDSTKKKSKLSSQQKSGYGDFSRW